MTTDQKPIPPTQSTPAGSRRETREEMIARVVREQEALNPVPLYTARSKRRLRLGLPLCPPVAFVLSWALSRATGWTTTEWVGFSAGLSIALAYLVYLFVAERDDGRINRATRDM